MRPSIIMQAINRRDKSKKKPSQKCSLIILKTTLIMLRKCLNLTHSNKIDLISYLQNLDSIKLTNYINY